MNARGIPDKHKNGRGLQFGICLLSKVILIVSHLIVKVCPENFYNK